MGERLLRPFRKKKDASPSSAAAASNDGLLWTAEPEKDKEKPHKEKHHKEKKAKANDASRGSGGGMADTHEGAQSAEVRL